MAPTAVVAAFHALRFTLTCWVLQSKHARGQIVNLLRVALEDSVDPAVRQVAAISFKNLVKRDWADEGACNAVCARCTATLGGGGCWLWVLLAAHCLAAQAHRV